jgi:hypothetical protein
MATFPTKGVLTLGEAPSKYDIDETDNEVKADTDGGYEFKRPRFTRKPPRIVKTGFIGLTHADYLVLLAFWDAHGTTVAFTYTDYVHGISRNVRFDKKPDWKPQIIGTRRLWNPSFEMKEV